MGAPVLEQSASGDADVFTGGGPYSLTVSLPAGPAEGSVLVLVAEFQGGGTITVPGWSAVAAESVANYKFHDRSIRAWVRTAGPSAPASVVMSATGAGCLAHWSLSEWSGATYAGAGSTKAGSSPTATAAADSTAGLPAAVVAGGVSWNQNTPTTQALAWTAGAELMEVDGSNTVQGAFGAAWRTVESSGATESMAVTGSGGCCAPTDYTTAVVAVALAGSAALGVWVDWDGDGFANEHSDVTSYVTGWRISRGASPELTGGSQPGSLAMTLRNPQDTDLFNPDNAAGDLFGRLRDGPAVWVGVSDAGTFSGDGVHGLFKGRITEVTPVFGGGSARAATVEVLAEDDLARLSRVSVDVAFSDGRSQADLRAAILLEAGVAASDLPPEPMALPVSGGSGTALAMLDALNSANGTRHFVAPPDDRDGDPVYTARARMHGLSGVADAAVDAGAEHVTGTSGWRRTADTVVNRQRVSWDPVAFTPATYPAWVSGDVPFDVTGTRRISIEFDDYVAGAYPSVNRTGSSMTATLVSHGTGGLLTLTSSGTTTVTSLEVLGSLARRGSGLSVTVDDAASQADGRGVRAGPDVSGDAVGTAEAARGLAAHVVWRYAEPQARPSLTVVNWLPEQLDLDLFDVLSVTVAGLQVDGRLFEVVGVEHECAMAAASGVSHTATWVLQESRVQAPREWFTLDQSALDGAADLGY